MNETNVRGLLYSDHDHLVVVLVLHQQTYNKVLFKQLSD